MLVDLSIVSIGTGKFKNNVLSTYLQYTTKIRKVHITKVDILI